MGHMARGNTNGIVKRPRKHRGRAALLNGSHETACKLTVSHMGAVRGREIGRVGPKTRRGHERPYQRVCPAGLWAP